MTTLQAVLGSPTSTPATRKIADLMRSAAGTQALSDGGWKSPRPGGTAVDPGELAALRKAWQDQR